jgi:hypothetical protein
MFTQDASGNNRFNTQNMAEQYFEMLWDCPQCSTKGLLGSTHRHCPTCGAAQDPSKRYFPEPGQEVEAQNHRFVGKDWSCAYCESPNSASSAFCGNCGAPKDGTREVTLIQDQPPPTTAAADTAQTALQTTPGRTGFPWLRAVFLLVLLAVAGWMYMLLSKHNEAVQLVDKAWTRQVAVERFTAVRASDWCDSLPAGAYGVVSSREQRSTRQIADGQTCHDVRTDKGDGTFTKQQECHTHYRSEPVFDDRCSYRINRWQVLRTDRLQGGATLMPTWPTPLLANNLAAGGLNALGGERLGARSEQYTVNLKSAKGKQWTCTVTPTLWAALNEGQAVNIQVRGTGGAACDSLAAAQ